jgi:uncharacterized protein
MNNLSWKTLVSFLVLGSVAGVVCGYMFITYYVFDQTRSAKQENQLVVYGEADLGVLDVEYTISYQCFAKDKVSAKAFETSSVACSKLAKTIQDLGVSKQKLTTQSLRMYNSGNYYNYFSDPNNPNGLDYTAEQTLVLKDKFEKDKQDTPNGLNMVIDKTGVLDNVAITNLALAPASDKQYDQKGRVLAIEDAKLRADQIAKSAGFKIGKVINVQDQQTGQIPYYNRSLLSSSDAKIATTEVFTGKNEITTRVSVTYEILR